MNVGYLRVLGLQIDDHWSKSAQSLAMVQVLGIQFQILLSGGSLGTSYLEGNIYQT